MMRKLLSKFKKVPEVQNKKSEEDFNKKTVAKLTADYAINEANKLDTTNSIVDIMIKEAQIKKNDRILDVGCYDGLYEMLLAKRGITNVTAVDISSDAIRVANEVKKKLGLKAEFKKADAERLPFEDGSFNCVLMLGLVHHLGNETAKKVLKEAKRVLAPGGTMVLADPNLYHPRIIRSHLLQDSSENELAYGFLEFRKLASKFFKIQTAYTLRYFPRTERLDGALKRLPVLNWFGAETLIIAKKG